MWQAIKRFRGTFASHNFSSNDHSVWINDFLNKLAPLSVPNLDSLPSPYPSSIPPHKLNEPFSNLELARILNFLKDSSPGLDRIPYSFYVNCGSTAKEFILSLINKVFELGIIPEPWKSQLVIPLLKPGKKPF